MDEARPDLFAPDDVRWLVAAAGSAVIPGLGQLINGRLRLAKWFGVPALILLAFVALRVATSSPARLFASVISPTVLGLLLALNVVVLAWRLAAVAHAFFDGRYQPRSGRGGAAGLALILVAVVVPHGLANTLGSSAQAAFSNVFASGQSTGPGPVAASTSGGPGSNDRLNILVTGVDSFPGRTETLTDSLMVVSVDPVGKTVSMISLPRDIIKVPLGNGNTFGPKINSLMSYADRHPDQFPQGGMRALEDAIGTMLGIRIHYYARIDFLGFVKLVDSVGGVDIDVKRAFDDPKYDGLGINPPNVFGFAVTAGPHHFNGYEALAYARSRYAIGESDFTRAGRQQEILIALKARLLSDGSLITRLPQLLDAFGALVRTDIPTDRLPDLAAMADELSSGSIYRMVLGHPLVKPGNDPTLGSIQVPDLPAIRAAVAAILPAPGKTPVAWTAPAP
ncbi:MAG: LCP family protein [Chloroflexi bacterium]|nr:LCP family protein [Chloroflexota bacterium]